MISKITGKIISKNPKYIVIDTGSLGYKVFTGNDILLKYKEGDDLFLWTHLIVRENVLDLYGFENQKELSFFEMLIDVSGIGPKSAIGILDLAPVETLQRAIGSGDISYLTKISGIGKKTAEKIIIELRDKLEKLNYGSENPFMKEEVEALEALKSLGYSQEESREALKLVSPEITSLNSKIKEALRILGQN